MARWLRDGPDVPDELSRPGPEHWPRGGWREACLAWLADHPGRRLPFGEYGDATDVYRLAREIRLSGP